MLNSCEFIGHLGADTETRSFQSGGKVCNFRLAVTEKWKKDGERQERTEWVSVAIFSEGLAGIAERYLRKGSKVYVRGQWRTRKWQDQSGNDRYSTECVLQGPDAKIVLLDGPGDQRGQQREPDGSQGHAQSGWGAGQPDMDDQIPFLTSDSIF